MDRDLPVLVDIQPLVKTWLAATLWSPMAQTSTSSSDSYAEFQAELDEVLHYKWIESEKAGHDIGFERALKEWTERHRENWRRKRRETAEKD